MSSNEHLEAIQAFAAHGKRMLEEKEPCDGDTDECPVWESVVDACFDDILPHAEALAAQVERLQAYALWLETEWCRPDWEGFRRRFPLFLRRDHNIQDGDLPEPEEP